MLWGLVAAMAIPLVILFVRMISPRAKIDLRLAGNRVEDLLEKQLLESDGEDYYRLSAGRIRMSLRTQSNSDFDIALSERGTIGTILLRYTRMGGELVRAVKVLPHKGSDLGFPLDEEEAPIARRLGGIVFQALSGSRTRKEREKILIGKREV